MTTPEAAGRRQAIWIVVAFLGVFFFQRIATPGLPIPITLPLTMVWLAFALKARIIELDATRSIVWLIVSGFTALLTIPQLFLLSSPLVSVTSWGLWIVVWMPLVFRFRERTKQAHTEAMRGIAGAGAGISSLAVLFILLQQIGIPYRDILAELLPESLLVPGFVTTYPIFWGSAIFKANAWFALEASFLSFMLGVAMVAALISRRHPVLVIWIGVGILCTTAGSGILVVLLYAIVSVIRGDGRHLVRYLLFGIPVLLIGVASALGEAILNRVGEAGDSRSSASLRAVEPYIHLVPRWLSDWVLTLIGGGAGSSQRVIEDLGIRGLLVPTPAKVLFDYGLLGGALMLAMILLAYRRSPAPALAFALVVSMLALQGSAQPLVILSLFTVTMFAPQQGSGDGEGQADEVPEPAEEGALLSARAAPRP
ncbi:MAG TPA: hypothetical protein PKE40_02540 [Arachnia sp.]|nr:hypothetical protein [Arachnia sp.]HMT85208.1 hypothetical protein [Arachnia sp.]